MTSQTVSRARVLLARLGLVVEGPSPEVRAFVDEVDAVTQRILEIAANLDKVRPASDRRRNGTH